MVKHAITYIFNESTSVQLAAWGLWDTTVNLRIQTLLFLFLMCYWDQIQGLIVLSMCSTTDCTGDHIPKSRIQIFD